MELTGGQWFLPLVILCIILGITESVAKKKKLIRLQRIVDISAYVLLVILLIIEWILYFQKQMDFITPAIYSLVVIYVLGRQITLHYRSTLQKRLGAKYKQLTIGLDVVYILFVDLLLLIGSHFSTTGWIIIGVITLIFAFIAYVFEKSRQ